MRTFKLKYIDTLLLIEYDGQKRTISVTDSQSTKVEFKLTKMDGRYEGRLSDILGIFTGILNEITAIDEFDQVDRFTPWKSEYGCGDDQLDLAWFNTFFNVVFVCKGYVQVVVQNSALIVFAQGKLFVAPLYCAHIVQRYKGYFGYFNVFIFYIGYGHTFIYVRFGKRVFKRRKFREGCYEGCRVSRTCCGERF